LLLDNGPAIYDSAAQLPDRYQRHKPHLALRRLRQRRHHTAVLDGNLHVPRGAISNANGDSDGNSHTDSYANGDSDSYAYTDSYANGDSDSYAHTDSDAYCDSDRYAYTDSNADGDSDGYAYTDSYAYVDAYSSAKSKPDTKAASDTATASVGSDFEACLRPWPWAKAGG
jgi:hypothetical protein